MNLHPENDPVPFEIRAPRRVLDLFCCAGCASRGYHRVWPDAEFVGVDIEHGPIPNGLTVDSTACGAG